MQYTLSLALVDFLPVFFTAIGLGFIARMVSHLSSAHGQAAYVGVGLTVAGGALKALWKLIMATTNGTVDIIWMEASLFPLMAPGYTLLTWAVWQAINAANHRRVFHAWLAPSVLIALMFALSLYLGVTQPTSPAWERVLLGVMVLATVITGLALSYFAFRQKLPLAGGLFMLNLIGIFALNGLARIPEQTIALQWIEESINAISWLAFGFAARQVYQYARAHYGVK